MTRTFKAPTQAEAHAKADAWLKSQPAMKSITRQAYVFRAAFPKQGLPKTREVGLSQSTISSIGPAT